MNASCVLLAGGRPADDGAQRDDRGLRGLGLGVLKSLIQSGGVFLIGAVLAQPVHALNVPAVGFVARQDVFVEGDRGVIFDRDVVIVPDDGDVTQLLCACEGGCLGGNAFFEASIACDDVDVVVEGGGAGGSLGGHSWRSRRPRLCRFPGGRS